MEAQHGAQRGCQQRHVKGGVHNGVREAGAVEDAEVCLCWRRAVGMGRLRLQQLVAVRAAGRGSGVVHREWQGLRRDARVKVL